MSFKYGELTLQLTRREIAARYRGSFIGLIWSFVNPVLMLALYTFVFSTVFQTKWNVGTDNSTVEFALILFSGLILHSLLSEILNRAPMLIVQNTSFVKKVVFPLVILPVVALLSAMFHAFISYCILFVALLVTGATVSLSALLLPVVVFPLIVLTLGVGWLLSALGVFVRDISQVTGLVTTSLLFLSPIFFPMEALPETYHTVFLLNPLSLIVESSRDVLLFNRAPNWNALAYYMAAASAFTLVSLLLFRKAKKGFADVL